MRHVEPVLFFLSLAAAYRAPWYGVNSWLNYFAVYWVVSLLFGLGGFLVRAFREEWRKEGDRKCD
jgi:hypothetical protein